MVFLTAALLAFIVWLGIFLINHGVFSVELALVGSLAFLVTLAQFAESIWGDRVRRFTDRIITTTRWGVVISSTIIAVRAFISKDSRTSLDFIVVILIIIVVFNVKRFPKD